MREVAKNLFGKPEDLHDRPNVFGELMRVLIYPSEDVKLAVNSVLGDGRDPDIAVHLRMLMNRYYHRNTNFFYLMSCFQVLWVLFQLLD